MICIFGRLGKLLSFSFIFIAFFYCSQLCNFILFFKISFNFFLVFQFIITCFKFHLCSITSQVKPLSQWLEKCTEVIFGLRNLSLDRTITIRAAVFKFIKFRTFSAKFSSQFRPIYKSRISSFMISVGLTLLRVEYRLNQALQI